MVGGTTVPWHHRNAQTYIKCTLTSSESVWTPASPLMARWHESLKFEWCMIIGVWEIRHSISEIVGPFEIPWFTQSCVYEEYLMEVQRFLMIIPRGIWLDLSLIRDMTMAQIKSPFSARNTKLISNRLTQKSLAYLHTDYCPYLSYFAM